MRLAKGNYSDRLDAVENAKGVLDVDTVKGCKLGMAAYPKGGCYGCCYANKVASLYGMNFRESFVRYWNIQTLKVVTQKVAAHHAAWYRIGNMGDPSHAWVKTAAVVAWLAKVKTAVVVTKHWITMTDEVMAKLIRNQAILNSIISALDTVDEMEHRFKQYDRYAKAGGKSVLRVVTCKFGETENGRMKDKIQAQLLRQPNVIDNPLRASKTHPLVVDGTITVEKRMDVNSESTISVHTPEVFTGHCRDCSEQCGFNLFK